MTAARADDPIACLIRFLDAEHDDVDLEAVRDCLNQFLRGNDTLDEAFGLERRRGRPSLRMTVRKRRREAAIADAKEAVNLIGESAWRQQVRQRVNKVAGELAKKSNGDAKYTDPLDRAISDYFKAGGPIRDSAKTRHRIAEKVGQSVTFICPGE